MPADIAEAYRAAQRSFVGLCGELTVSDWATPVPATPGWTVRDVLSHVAGVADDIVHGNVEGAATEPWTAAQVERWRDAPVGEMIERWAAQVDQVAHALQAIGEGRPPVDCHSHEHDVRHALGRFGARNTALIRWIAERIEGNPIGRPVTIHVGDGEVLSIAGEGEPLELHGVDRFESIRSRVGRRSRAQVLAYAWSMPPTDDELDHWFVFGRSTHDIVEP